MVLRDKAAETATQMLDLLGFAWVPTDMPVAGHRVDATPAKTGAYESHFAELTGDVVPTQPWVANTPKRVFIARRGSRALLNHDAVAEFLDQRGFVTRYFEDLPVIEQWSTLRQAEAVVATHGAALSHLIWARNRPRVVELFHPMYVVDCYRNLTTMIGGDWVGVTGRLTGDDLKAVEEQDQPRACQARPIEIDLSSLELAMADERG